MRVEDATRSQIYGAVLSGPNPTPARTRSTITNPNTQRQSLFRRSPEASRAFELSPGPTSQAAVFGPPQLVKFVEPTGLRSPWRNHCHAVDCGSLRQTGVIGHHGLQIVA